ncbi:hypothetical protein PSPO01_14843 [Paraphaeosphaeria sporulosa]
MDLSTILNPINSKTSDAQIITTSSLQTATFAMEAPRQASHLVHTAQDYHSGSPPASGPAPYHPEPPSRHPQPASRPRVSLATLQPYLTSIPALPDPLAEGRAKLELSHPGTGAALADYDYHCPSCIVPSPPCIPLLSSNPFSYESGLARCRESAAHRTLGHSSDSALSAYQGDAIMPAPPAAYPPLPEHFLHSDVRHTPGLYFGSDDEGGTQEQDQQREEPSRDGCGNAGAAGAGAAIPLEVVGNVTFGRWVSRYQAKGREEREFVSIG